MEGYNGGGEFVNLKVFNAAMEAMYAKPASAADYERIAQTMEYDSERAGGFAPLRFVPPGKTIALGLVTTKSGGLESRDLLKRRIEEAARFCPLEQLALSPQCGFSSGERGNPLTLAEQTAKLALIVKVARDVWGEA